MSRLGNKPIVIPEKVSCEIKNGENSKGQIVVMTGPRGVLSQKILPNIVCDVQGERLYLSRSSNQKKDKALHGLYSALVRNNIIGVTKGFRKDLELVGVGYKAHVDGKKLYLELGYAHSICVVLPEIISAAVEKEDKLIISFFCNDKQLLGQFVDIIKNRLKKVNLFNLKGFFELGEKKVKKVGKSASKK